MRYVRKIRSGSLAVLLCLCLAGCLTACGQGEADRAVSSETTETTSILTDGSLPTVSAETTVSVSTDQQIAAAKEFQAGLQQTVDWPNKKVIATVNGDPIYDADLQIAKLQLAYQRQATDLSLYSPEQQAELQARFEQTDEDLLREKMKTLVLIQRAGELGDLPSDEELLAVANQEGYTNSVTITGEEGDFFTAFVNGLGMDRDTFVREIWLPNLRGLGASNWVQKQFLEERQAQSITETEELHQAYFAYRDQVEEELLSKAEIQYLD